MYLVKREYELNENSKEYEWKSVYPKDKGEFLRYLASKESILTQLFSQIEGIATNSDCERKKMGCILTDERFVVLSRGYNHKPFNISCKEAHCTPETSCRLTIHAEQDALLKYPLSSTSMYLFCTAAPCLDCTKACMTSGVRAVLYLSERPQPDLDRPMLSYLSKYGSMEYIQIQ